MIFCRKWKLFSLQLELLFQNNLAKSSVSEIQFTEEDSASIFSMSPGKGKQSVLIYANLYCKELAHPYLFPTGEFGYIRKRNIQLYLFNRRLINHTVWFSSDSDYIFSAHSIHQKMHPNDQINLAIHIGASAN